MNGKVRETLPLAITVRWASLFNDRLVLRWEKNLIFEWWGCSALVTHCRLGTSRVVPLV